MSGSAARRSILIVGLVLSAAACSTTRQVEAPPPAQTPGVRQASELPSAAKEPDAFESQHFIVTKAKAGDTPEALATRHLGDPKKKWMIEDFTGARVFSEGQEVVIPKHDWNPVGVFPWGYQLVPVLVYHNISATEKGRLSIAVRNFEAQMRQLQDEGFQTVSLAEFLAFTAGRRQLPRKSVLLTFDDGYKSFVQYARSTLKDYGFGATLFVYSDFIGAGSGLSWQDLRALSEQGYDVQAHSKSHANLRRKEGESEAAYAKRIEAELGYPLTLFKKYLGRSSESLAYPYGEVDDELLGYVAKYGYTAAFTVRRQSNAAFVSPLKISRSQIYAEMTVQDFAKNLAVFQDQAVGTATTSDERLPGSSPPVSSAGPTTPVPWSRDRLVALHNERSEQLELRGRLRQALDERAIALTINPEDRKAHEGQQRLGRRIAQAVTGLLQEGRAFLDRGLIDEARARFLTALSLEPTNRTAFEALQNEVREVMFITHTIRSGDTCASLAELYYGDQLRCEVIKDSNPRVPFRVGQKIRIPAIPGIPMLLH
jgi:peptidoglycan/xylan/chitin deacetylase (PgdA/CDA1 family)/nucleoid-associated protein YgaU